MDWAKDWAKDSGWLPRDVLTSAANGVLLTDWGEPKITTPTANVKRDASLLLVGNTDTPVPLTAALWDNNVFWNAAINPSRLTIRAPGLYLMGVSMVFLNTTSAALVYPRIKVNGTDLITTQQLPRAANVQAQVSTYAIYYFNEGDYIEAWALSTVAGNVQVRNLWILAITPEGII